MYKLLSPSITASDLAASRKFYEDALGLEVTDTYEEDGKVLGLKMQAGGVQYFLSQDDFAKGSERTKGVGMRFYISCDDVDAAAKRVEESGYEFFQPLTDQPWGTRDFAVQDPDGFITTVSREGM